MNIKHTVWPVWSVRPCRPADQVDVVALWAAGMLAAGRESVRVPLRSPSAEKQQLQSRGWKSADLTRQLVSPSAANTVRFCWSLNAQKSPLNISCRFFCLLC